MQRIEQQNQERYDSGDLDAILELIQSPGWKLVRNRISAEIERGRDSLERGGDPERLRGEIASFRTVLAIPGILEDEINVWL